MYQFESKIIQKSQIRLKIFQKYLKIVFGSLVTFQSTFDIGLKDSTHDLFEEKCTFESMVEAFEKIKGIFEYWCII